MKTDPMLSFMVNLNRRENRTNANRPFALITFRRRQKNKTVKKQTFVDGRLALYVTVVPWLT